MSKHDVDHRSGDGPVRERDRGGQRNRLNRSLLAGRSYDEQVQLVSDPKAFAEAQRALVSPAGGQSTAPVQMAKAPVQMKMERVKTHPHLGMSQDEMGPYEYLFDDSEPEKGRYLLTGLKDLNDDELWEACLESKDYGPETQTVANVTKAKKDERIKAARKRLLGKDDDAILKKIIAVDDGANPRAFTSVVDEHGLNGDAHCHDRHVFGAGTIGDVLALSVRAGWRTPFAPDDQGCASAWTNLSAANSVVSSALSTLFANWKTVRVTIARGSQLDTLEPPLGGNVMSLQKADDPVGTAYADTDKPKYRGGNGYRPMYPGEPEWQTAKSQAEGSLKEGETNPYTETAKNNPLTNDVTSQLTKAKVFVVPDKDTAGGWFVVTAYPV